MSLYWLQQTLAVLPLVLWVYIALGIPWALLILPRSDWSQKVTVKSFGKELCMFLRTYQHSNLC